MLIRSKQAETPYERAILGVYLFGESGGQMYSDAALDTDVETLEGDDAAMVVALADRFLQHVDTMLEGIRVEAAQSDPTRRDFAGAIAVLENARRRIVEIATELRARTKAVVSGVMLPIGALPLMLGGAMQITFESLIADEKEKAWKGLRSAQPPYYGDPRGTHVTIGDPRPDAELLTPEQQEASANTVLSLDDEHAQTFAFLMMHWMVQNDGREAPLRARVHVNELLEFRELERKKRDFRPEQKREERDRILRLAQMWIVVREKVVPRGKKRATKDVDVHSRLIELAIETEANGVGAPIPLLTGGVPPASIPYAFRYEPGEWVTSFRGNPNYVGTIYRKVLSYDTRLLAERMAMRIALYLSFVPLRTERTVEDLFHGAHISLPTVQPKRSRDAFEDALGRLRDDGIIADYEYIGGDPPQSGKGWSRAWLAARLLVHPVRENGAIGPTSTLAE